VNIWQPSTGRGFRTGSDVTIQVNSFGGDGTVAKVEFFSGSEKIGEAEGGNLSTTWKKVPEGEHRLKAKVTDGSGNTGESPEVQITVGSRISGVFVEAETGTGDAASKNNDGASGGKVLSDFRGNKKIEYVIEVAERVPNAQVAIRATGGSGRFRIKLGPADGNLRDRGTVHFPGRQVFVWKKRPVGGVIEPGRYRLVLETGRKRDSGALDVVGIVSDAAFALLPNKVAGPPRRRDRRRKSNRRRPRASRRRRRPRRSPPSARGPTKSSQRALIRARSPRRK
jgi:hypothetical protein